MALIWDDGNRITEPHLRGTIRRGNSKAVGWRWFRSVVLRWANIENRANILVQSETVTASTGMRQTPHKCRLGEAAAHLIYLLRPHHRNFNKRLIKAPKLYFCDVGLAAWLLGIQDAKQLRFHAQRGALFATFVVTEILKSRMNAGLPLNLYYWRDSKGLEINLLLENGEQLIPVEIKSGQTVASDFFDTLKRWTKLSGMADPSAWLVYGGDRELSQGPISIVPWRNITNGLPINPT